MELFSIRIQRTFQLVSTPPDTTAGIFWLKNRKPEQWNRPAPRAEDDAYIPTDIEHGINIDSWIKDKLK
ncbi:hypothetical protein GAY75_19140 [Phocaeicola vulgatus]|nr:hypothetical protein GAY75_19140 [Phocaeicola vulgatus]KAB6581442.1 hypothetical protein GAY78_18520 [Phocaeicola vulgatus]KAB6587017.1 hypothetical protein GAY83_18985 [Phocaeicola vulgatus]